MISKYLSEETLEKVADDLFEIIHTKLDETAKRLNINLNAIDYDFAVSDASFVFLRKDLVSFEEAKVFAKLMNEDQTMKDLMNSSFMFDDTDDEEIKDWGFQFYLNTDF